jgi:hypothetical protein
MRFCRAGSRHHTVLRRLEAGKNGSGCRKPHHSSTAPFVGLFRCPQKPDCPSSALVTKRATTPRLRGTKSRACAPSPWSVGLLGTGGKLTTLESNRVIHRLPVSPPSPHGSRATPDERRKMNFISCWYATKRTEKKAVSY